MTISLILIGRNMITDILYKLEKTNKQSRFNTKLYNGQTQTLKSTETINAYSILLYNY